MSAQITPAEHVCYVHCNFCNTILAVSVPGNSMLNIVTVRCGHCTNLLSVNLRGLMQHSAPAPQDHHHHHLQESMSGCFRDQSGYPEFGLSAASSSSKLRLQPPSAAAMVSYSQQNQQLEQALHLQRRGNGEEIRRIKANNPDISHREAFSTAAKNWAHYPNIHFGLSPAHEGGKKLVEVDAIPTPSSKKIQGFYS
uniref:Uncharacterized protein n=1 Tax=Leersia perrieri TaxID=77586 RepID=A0A0D9Y1M0_9ORYZ